MQTAVLDRMQTLSRASEEGTRVSLTELARSAGWRKQLKKLGVMEVVDRTETEAFLVSRDGMADLMETIDSLEEQVEQAQIAAMLAARGDRDNWMSGEALADRAWDELVARRESFAVLADD